MKMLKLAKRRCLGLPIYNFFFCILFLFPLHIHAIILQEEVWHDLELQGLSQSALKNSQQKILDVAIIGGGQSGMSLCLALWKRGIFNVHIFDGARKGFEGPWLNSARMNTLRSPKHLLGPSLGILHLSFRTWYETQYGNWKSLGKIPREIWAEYLQWYRSVLNLPIENECCLLTIEPENNVLRLFFDDKKEILAHKVVLATGREGFGGFEIPAFIKNLPKQFWFHTGELIDPALLSGKRICVIGAGASAADIAAVALENGAQCVQMLMRKAQLPKPGLLAQSKFWHTFYSLSDEERACCFQTALANGISIPAESLQRLKYWKTFSLLSNINVEQITVDTQLSIHTNQGLLEADLVILATGYAVDLSSVSVLRSLSDKILLWQHRLKGLSPKLGQFPYLGPHFEFMERDFGSAPFLKNIYCFNYGAFLSHGRIVGDIDQLPFGVERLVEGIYLDLATNDPHQLRARDEPSACPAEKSH